MLITFKTPHHAHVTLFGDVALRLLSLMGHSGTLPGAFAVEDVPLALLKLRDAIDIQPTFTHDNNDETISLRQRALPLIELLETATKNQQSVLFNV